MLNARRIVSADDLPAIVDSENRLIIRPGPSMWESVPVF